MTVDINLKECQIEHDRFCVPDGENKVELKFVGDSGILNLVLDKKTVRELFMVTGHSLFSDEQLIDSVIELFNNVTK